MKTHTTSANEGDLLIAHPLRCLEERLSYHSDAVRLTHSRNARTYLRLQLAEEMNEVFAVLFLNN
ncbi:MAG: hypothetical protein K0S27_475 [Gammaproteobacteria bacterium]|jgi:DNA repair protein RadC|nr:hypothetical protein [Gammaproteobacteria bacterium]